MHSSREKIPDCLFVYLGRFHKSNLVLQPLQVYCTLVLVNQQFILPQVLIKIKRGMSPSVLSLLRFFGVDPMIRTFRLYIKIVIFGMYVLVKLGESNNVTEFQNCPFYPCLICTVRELTLVRNFRQV